MPQVSTDPHELPPGFQLDPGDWVTPPDDHPVARSRAPVDIQVKLRGGQGGFNPDRDLPEWKPPQQTRSRTGNDPFAGLPDWQPPAKGAAEKFNPDDLPEWQPKGADDWVTPPEDVGTLGAAGRGAVEAGSFGFAPALAGLREAAGPDVNQALDQLLGGHPMGQAIGLGIKHTVGAARLLADAIGAHSDPAVRAAYERGRQAALNDQRLAQEAHPWSFLAGQLGASLAMPIPGLGAGAGLGARLARGAAVGAGAGALGGAGEALSEGAGVPGVAARALSSGAVGGLTGGALGGILGPRVARAAATPGERAAETAANLGAPLPRGLASDNSAIQATTAKLRSLPIVGSRISDRVNKAAQAAGQRIEDITGQMAGGATDRAAADAIIRPALQDVVDNNNARADALYSAVRNQINPDRAYQLPRTQALLDRIISARRAAGWTDPERGLEQFQNIAESGSFNGAHRARSDARNAGSVLNPNPGYNKGEFNALTRAMTADIRNLVHTEGGQAALDAFDKAENQFGKMAEQNLALNNLINARGEGAIATLLGSAKERGGNVQLLAQLRRSMNPQDFQQIGGTLLHELGQNPSSGEFSLAKFVTNWGKVSDRAKGVLFSQQHLKDINDIVGMGQHIKGALRESNTSHTAGVLILFDLARDAAMLGATMGAGALTAGSVVGAVPGAAGIALAHWLGSPAKAASMRAFTKSYQGWLGSPTPARAAAFRIATRNLANNLGMPVEEIAKRVAGVPDPHTLPPGFTIDQDNNPPPQRGPQMRTPMTAGY